MSTKKLNRREFLGSASCSAIGMTTFFSTLFNLGAANVVAQPKRVSKNGRVQDDYRALVCILLAGGNDSFNMLVPRGDSEHAEYQVTRSNLALAKDSLLPLNAATYNTQQLGLHPSMTEIQKLFNDGKIAFISNVGTLVEPVTKPNLWSQTTKLPVGLFSHADQIQHWQTSIPQSRQAIGWGGRLADLLQASNSNQNISMNISLSGNNVFQAGNIVSEYTVSPNGLGAVGIRGYNGVDIYDQIRTTAVKSLMEQEYQDIFKKTYAQTITQGQEGSELFQTAVGGVQIRTQFSGDYIAQSLKMIARIIGGRSTLGQSRQTFFLTFGGWDHHDEVLNNQAGMLRTLSRALNQFNSALEELNVSDSVTTFNISDFGRTLTSNGNGTDHAWGGNVMVMGGSVKGGDIYGSYPSLALNGPLEVGDGVFIPSLSTDEYFAELALWLGVSPNDLGLVLPNIGNFYAPSNGNLPIGFMKNV